MSPHAPCHCGGTDVAARAFHGLTDRAGYLRVPQVSEHGEFAVRGSLIDIFPMGTDAPVRIDFFDDDIESLRYFSAETQLSGERLESSRHPSGARNPARRRGDPCFRDRYRERFEGQPGKSRVYREVSDGIAHGGIEYYLPLFFETTATLLDYLPDDCVVLAPNGLEFLLRAVLGGSRERYELCSLDPERPILSSTRLLLRPTTVR